ncbi:C39 family peptidase [Streptomyces sp. NPDC058045]|uniref:C39 family peptidase n=1 Tax=Streptomyces sp. NPDC058045 TaxID=3346311 RepID=UPI0036E897DB
MSSRIGSAAAKLLAVSGMVAGVVAGTAGAAAAATATVGNTDGVGLTVRSAPGTSGASQGLAHDGQSVDVSCQVRGESVTNLRGFTSDLWDYVPELDGYLADAYMATGHDDRIPGVPECDQSSSGRYVPVSQFQGQPNEGEDCGPTSVVTALLAAGVTPRSWDPSNPVLAINQARADMGYDPGVQDPEQYGTGEGDVRQALAANGVTGEVSGDLDQVLSHVREGRPVVMAGNMVDLPWSGHFVPHFLTVAGYENGEYLVLDPASETIVYRTSAQVLAAFWDHEYGRAGVML